MRHEERLGNGVQRDPSPAVRLDTSRHSVQPPPTRATLLARGIAKRCPWCGGGDLFPSWFAMRARCPNCGLRLDRGESDFWIGAWMLNLVGAETVFALLLAAGVVLLWPDVPWTAVTWIGALGMLLIPLALFPVSRTLWLAIDMVFQPHRSGDFEQST